MKKISWSMALILLVVMSLSAHNNANAWELTMEGGFTWEYKLYSQLGSNGFFGPYNVDNAAVVGDAASLNGWLGNEITAAGLVSGSDVSGASMYISFSPEIKINKAVTMSGSYYIGGWDNQPVGGAAAAIGRFWAPEYFNSTIPGVQSSFSPGYWNTFSLSAETPWGILVVGKRPFSFGTGLTFDGEDNTTIESILLVAPYGPMKLGLLWHPWRQGLAYPVLTDKNAAREISVGTFLKYSSGPMVIGSVIEYAKYHLGPESAVTQANRLTVIPTETSVTDGNFFFKYNNGRFFLNAEAGWYDEITRRHRDLANTPPPVAGAGSLFRPTYVDHWRYMVEMGAFAGPSKISLLWAWIAGPDRRHGILNDRNSDSRALTQLSNFSVFRPYSMLLAWNYGSGNNSLTASVGDIGSDNGYVTVYAARLDYAVAANLNVYTSFVWAERLSHGYGWGHIGPNLVGGVPDGTVAFADKGTFAAPSPAIPDNHLGWEINAGLDWQILEGYTISAAFGYWKPGKWFNYACLDRSNTGWKAPAAGNNWGTNPGRDIDPIFGMDITLVGEF
jgi:hypothetical protein